VTTHQSQVPTIAAHYFASVGVDMLDAQNHPLIASTFGPGPAGVKWRRYPIRKRVSGSAVRKLRTEGVTHVALSAGGHVADFTTAELCANGGK
jgi:hypothetical protein